MFYTQRPLFSKVAKNKFSNRETKQIGNMASAGIMWTPFVERVLACQRDICPRAIDEQSFPLRLLS